MNMRQLVAALLAVAMFAPLTFAQDAQPKAEPPKEEPAKEPAKEAAKEPAKEPPKEGEDTKKEGEKKEDTDEAAAVFKDFGEVVGKVEFSEDDVKAFLKHYAEFDKLSEADEKYKEARQKNLKSGFDILVKSEKYVAWAKAKELDADVFLRKGMRIFVLTIKEFSVKSAEEQIAASAKQIEGMKDELSEEDFKMFMAQIDSARKSVASMKKALEAVSGPTEAERKALAASKEALVKIVDDEEDGDSIEDAEGMDG